MGRPLSTGFENKLSAAATTPGYLVEIEFPAIVRWSSLGGFLWNSQTWTSNSFSVSGFGIDGSAESSGSLTFNNHDNSVGTLCLANGVSNRAIRLYAFDGLTPASDEVRQIFDGYTDSFALNMRRVTISAVLRGKQSKKIPSIRIARTVVRQQITRPGTRFFWNEENYTLDNPK